MRFCRPAEHRFRYQPAGARLDYLGWRHGGGPIDNRTEKTQVPPTQRTIHPILSSCWPRTFHLSLAGALLLWIAFSPIVWSAPSWDCRATADGRSWSCDQRSSAGTASEAEDPATTREGDEQTAPAAIGRKATPPASQDVSSDPVSAPKIDPAAGNEDAVAPRVAAPADDPAQRPPEPGSPKESAATANDDRAHKPRSRSIQQTPSQAAPGPEPQRPAATSAALSHALDIDTGINWDDCPTRPRAAPTAFKLDQEHDTDLPIDVDADAVIADLGPEEVTFSGNVRLVQGDLQVQADQLVLNRSKGQIQADGDILISRPDLRVAGSAASYQLEAQQGTIEQVRYRVPGARARGQAEQAEFLGDGQSRYADISYTTCAPGDDAWLLKAKTLKLDQVEGFGSAQHATLRFMGVPMLYAPTFTFPIDDRRRSGVLLPTVGQSSNTGFDLRVPYYFNLAENYDLTLTPRLMTKRGLMLGGEFRFLTASTFGTLNGEYLPSDQEFDGDRGSLAVRTTTRFNPRTTGVVRFNYASDEDYFEDLGDSLAATSATHLERAGELRYAADTWGLLGRVQYYQTIDRDIPAGARPYSRLPQLLVDLEDPDGIAGTSYYLDAEYVNFYRRDSVRGHRLTLFPKIGLPLRNSWGFIEPRVGAHYASYRLTDQQVGLDDAPDSLIGLFSLDSGLYFDRDTNYFGHEVTHTLEPRLFYLYVPETDQDDQPIFDTGFFDFNFDNLFRENRFNGPDRFADANQLTAALTSRLFAEQNGAELLRASLGQTYYFKDREVSLPGEVLADDSSSAVVAELAAELGAGWRARAGVQWDPHEGRNGNTDQALAQLNYRNRNRLTFNAAYRLRDQVAEQTDLGLLWPINANFSLIGRHNYSLQEDRLLEALFGIEYGRCCWRFRGLVRQYTDSSDDDTNLGFFLQLELNGLGSLGDNIDEVLERGIYGYQAE